MEISMKTKYTLAYDNETSTEFHLYEEPFDNSGAVYLSLTDPEFRVTADPEGYTDVVVRIPKDVWNKIVQIGTRDREDFWEE